MAGLLTPIQRAERLAAQQEGALHFDQALAAGLSPDQVHRLTTAGRWRRAVVGVFVVAGAPDTSRQRLTTAYLATRAAGGVVSHVSAGAEWSLVPASPLPHVTVPPGTSAACRAAKVHRSIVPAVDRAHRGALVVTSVSRTIVDLAAMLDRPTFERAVDTALCRKLASPSSIDAAAARSGRRRAGSALLRSTLEAWSPSIEPGSPAEVRLLRQAAELGIVGLVAQYEVEDEAGRFVARLDLAQPERRRGFEYDGVEVHNPRHWGRDETRYARLRALGWEIESITKLDLCPGEPRLRDIARRWACRIPLAACRP